MKAVGRMPAAVAGHRPEAGGQDSTETGQLLDRMYSGVR